MARTTAGTTPAASPGRPAWAAPTTPATGSASSTGVQSAVSTASASGRSVTTASTVGASPGGWRSVTTATSAPCTWFIHTTSAGSSPSSRAASARFSRTASGSSPTAPPRLSSPYGEVLTPPHRSVKAK